MSKQNKKQPYHRRHHVRVSAVAIAIAAGLHIGAAGHIKEGSRQTAVALNAMHALTSQLERGNETARHMVRFDEGLRLPTTSGGMI